MKTVANSAVEMVTEMRRAGHRAIVAATPAVQFVMVIPSVPALAITHHTQVRRVGP